MTQQLVLCETLGSCMHDKYPQPYSMQPFFFFCFFLSFYSFFTPQRHKSTVRRVPTQSSLLFCPSTPLRPASCKSSTANWQMRGTQQPRHSTSLQHCTHMHQTLRITAVYLLQCVPLKWVFFFEFLFLTAGETRVCVELWHQHNSKLECCQFILAFRNLD